MGKNAPHSKSKAAAPATDDDVTPEELTLLLEEQGEVIAEQQAELGTLKNKMEELLAALPAKKALPSRGSFTLKGKQYSVLYGVQIEQDGKLRTVSPADIEREIGLQEHLIESGSGAIQPIN